jgi:acetolactate synthase small subunit
MLDHADTRLVPARFLVHAEASPGLLTRLLAPLAKRDLVPDAFHARRQDGTDLMRADLVLRAMPAGMVHLVAGNLAQVVGVHSVQTMASQDARREAA